MRFAGSLIVVKDIEKSKRFYDPDGHLIEVGESLREVCKRFLKQGMSIENSVKRTMLPEKFIRSCSRRGL